jgi:hypothetical protein
MHGFRSSPEPAPCFQIVFINGRGAKAMRCRQVSSLPPPGVIASRHQGSERERVARRFRFLSVSVTEQHREVSLSIATT